MGKERISLVQSLRVAEHFTGRDTDKSVRTTIFFSESGPMVIAEDVIDGVSVCFPLKQNCSSSLAGTFSFNPQFLSEVLKRGRKEGKQYFLRSNDLLGMSAVFDMEGERSLSRVILKEREQKLASIRDHFRKERPPDFEIPAKDFRSALDTVKFVVHQDDGDIPKVMIDISPDRLTVAATNYYEFCQVEQKRQGIGNERGGFVIPPSCAKKLAFLLRTNLRQVPLKIYTYDKSDYYLRFSFLDYQLFTPFSPLRAETIRKYVYIPSDDQVCTRVNVKTEALLEAVKVALPKRVRYITLSVCGKEFTFSSIGSPSYSGEDNLFDTKGIVDAEVSGQNAEIPSKDIVVSLDPRSLLGFLKGVTEKKLQVGFSGPDKPVVFRSVGDRNIIYLLMPVIAK